MRRRLMLRNEGGGFLYPLVAGTRTNGFTITTNENGHVIMYNASRQTANKYANLRNVAIYFTSTAIEQMSRPLWFELRTGAECVFESLNKPTGIQLHLYIANSTTAYKSMSSSATSISFTVENDVEIGCVGLYTTAAIAAGTTNEFDISLTVDGRRYF